MSQYADDEEVPQTFDINDPSFLADLGEIRPDIDPDAVPIQTRPAPIADGVHWIKVRLRADKEAPVYFKNPRRDPDTGRYTADSVVAVLTPRIVDENGTEKGFLKDWYASTATPKVQPGAPPKPSALTYICKSFGKPIQRGWDLAKIKTHVESVFAEAGEEGIMLLVRTQWVKSVARAQDINGLITYVYKADGRTKEYDEVRGMNKILELAARQGIPEDQDHIWYDPVSGEERTVSSQVQRIEDPAKYQMS